MWVHAPSASDLGFWCQNPASSGPGPFPHKSYVCCLNIEQKRCREAALFRFEISAVWKRLRTPRSRVLAPGPPNTRLLLQLSVCPPSSQQCLRHGDPLRMFIPRPGPFPPSMLGFPKPQRGLTRNGCNLCVFVGFTRRELDSGFLLWPPRRVHRRIRPNRNQCTTKYIDTPYR
jgi:hypothetical protein